MNSPYSDARASETPCTAGGVTIRARSGEIGYSELNAPVTDRTSKDPWTTV